MGDHCIGQGRRRTTITVATPCPKGPSHGLGLRVSSEDQKAVRGLFSQRTGDTDARSAKGRRTETIRGIEQHDDQTACHLRQPEPPSQPARPGGAGQRRHRALLGGLVARRSVHDAGWFREALQAEPGAGRRLNIPGRRRPRNMGLFSRRKTPATYPAPYERRNRIEIMFDRLTTEGPPRQMPHRLPVGHRPRGTIIYGFEINQAGTSSAARCRRCRPRAASGTAVPPLCAILRRSARYRPGADYRSPGDRHS